MLNGLLEMATRTSVAAERMGELSGAAQRRCLLHIMR